MNLLVFWRNSLDVEQGICHAEAAKGTDIPVNVAIDCSRPRTRFQEYFVPQEYGDFSVVAFAGGAG